MSTGEDMDGNLKFELLFKDRIGIVFDIARLMSEQSLNIVAMEVEQKNGFAKISIEIEKQIVQGKVTYKGVADTFNLDYTPVTEVL